MSKYETIFDQIGDAKEFNSWLPPFPQGKHRVALLKYGPKKSGKDKSTFLEAEFMIISSANPEVRAGTKHSVPWFINKPDEYGYTAGRAKQFLRVLQESTVAADEQQTVTAFGQALVGDFAEDGEQNYFGAMVDVDVTFATKGGAVVKSKKGEDVLNNTFLTILPSEQDIEGTRDAIETLGSRPAIKPTAPKAPAPVKEPEVPAAPAPAPKKLGGLGGLKRPGA